MFRLVEQARKNQSDPMEMLRDVTKNYSPEQMESLINRARQFGIPEEVLQKVQGQK